MFPVELKDKDEESLHPIHDLLELDVLNTLYRRLIEDDSLGGIAQFGYLPYLALNYIGNNLASSYCERVNSCAKLIMTSDRSRLKSDHLEKVCFLRMNRDVIVYLRAKHPEKVHAWKDSRDAADTDTAAANTRYMEEATEEEDQEDEEEDEEEDTSSAGSPQ